MNIVKSDPESILYGNQQMNNFGIFAQDQFKMMKDKNGNAILVSTIGARADYNKVISGIESFQVSPKFHLFILPSITIASWTIRLSECLQEGLSELLHSGTVF